MKKFLAIAGTAGASLGCLALLLVLKDKDCITEDDELPIVVIVAVIMVGCVCMGIGADKNK